MDSLAQLLPESISPSANLWLGYQNFIPYLILLVNFYLFKLLRSLSDTLSDWIDGDASSPSRKQLQQQQQQQLHHHQPNQQQSQLRSQIKRLLKSFIGELISTCELCADCAELNVVYERHGPFAYAAGLFLLSYLWIEAFGEAHTSPGYLAEELLLVEGRGLLMSGDTYARFIGQSFALPFAWRFASFYWQFNLLAEHQEMLVLENCKSALSTSTIKGFLIECGCCLLCRLIELLGHRLLERKSLSKRLVSLTVSFSCTLLVMFALQLSGGYFNPILAASLEYGCKGIHFYQHAIVFWLGPLLGHVLARFIYRRLTGDASSSMNGDHPKQEDDNSSRKLTTSGRSNKSHANDTDAARPKRTTSQRRKRHRD